MNKSPSCCRREYCRCYLVNVYSVRCGVVFIWRKLHSSANSSFMEWNMTVKWSYSNIEVWLLCFNSSFQNDPKAAWRTFWLSFHGIFSTEARDQRFKQCFLTEPALMSVSFMWMTHIIQFPAGAKFLLHKKIKESFEKSPNYEKGMPRNMLHLPVICLSSILWILWLQLSKRNANSKSFKTHCPRWIPSGSLKPSDLELSIASNPSLSVMN